MEVTAARDLYAGVLNGADATEAEVAAFAANMLYLMAEMSCEDGLVMQIHPGVLRNHNTAIAKTYGQDKGHDIPAQTEFTKALRPMLERFGTILASTSSSSPLMRPPTAGSSLRSPVLIPQSD